MAAIKLRWPTALVQFEDFQSKHAIKLLMRYKKEYLMFNDDIQVEFRRQTSLQIQEKPTNNDLQGTAATVLAGLYGAMKVRGLTPADLKNQVLPEFRFHEILVKKKLRSLWLLELAALEAA